MQKKTMGYKGNPDGQDIYHTEVGHGYGEPLAGGTDVMRKLQNQLLIEQGSDPRPDSPRLAKELDNVWVVRDPSPESGLRDILYKTDSNSLASTAIGTGLVTWKEENTTLHDAEASAKSDALARLKTLSKKTATLAALERLATEWPTDDARKKHLDEHPGADPSDHTVKDKKDKPSGGKAKGPANPKAQKAWQAAGDAVAKFQDVRKKEQSLRRDLNSDNPSPQSRGKALDYYDASITHAKKVVDHAETILAGIDPESLDEGGQKAFSAAKALLSKAQERVKKAPKDSKYVRTNEDPLYLGGMVADTAEQALKVLFGIMGKRALKQADWEPGEKGEDGWDEGKRVPDHRSEGEGSLIPGLEEKKAFGSATRFRSNKPLFTTVATKDGEDYGLELSSMLLAGYKIVEGPEPWAKGRGGVRYALKVMVKFWGILFPADENVGSGDNQNTEMPFTIESSIIINVDEDGSVWSFYAFPRGLGKTTFFQELKKLGFEPTAGYRTNSSGGSLGEVNLLTTIGAYMTDNAFKTTLGMLQSAFDNSNKDGGVEGLGILASSEKKANEVAQTILKQMGGTRKLKMMIGANTFVAGSNWVSFFWPNKNRTKGNFVKVILEPSDTYKMEFANVAGSSYKVVKVYDDVYFDQLIPIFEKQTGWYLRMASKTGSELLDALAWKYTGVKVTLNGKPAVIKAVGRGDLSHAVIQSSGESAEAHWLKVKNIMENERGDFKSKPGKGHVQATLEELMKLAQDKTGADDETLALAVLRGFVKNSSNGKLPAKLVGKDTIKITGHLIKDTPEEETAYWGAKMKKELPILVKKFRTQGYMSQNWELKAIHFNDVDVKGDTLMFHRTPPQKKGSLDSSLTELQKMASIDPTLEALEKLAGKIAARSLSDIAKEIRQDWKDVNYAAKPYLEAMRELDSIGDSYGADSAKSIVAYFLSNASKWKGDKAKAIKLELNKMLKSKGASTDKMAAANTVTIMKEFLASNWPRAKKALEDQNWNEAKRELEQIQHAYFYAAGLNEKVLRLTDTNALDNISALIRALDKDEELVHYWTEKVDSEGVQEWKNNIQKYNWQGSLRAEQVIAAHDQIVGAAFREFGSSVGGRIATLFFEGGPVPAKKALDKMFAKRRASSGDELEARYEEGKPADPTENMTEEDAKEWRLQNLKHKDKFKTASGDTVYVSVVSKNPISIRLGGEIKFPWESKDGDLVTCCPYAAVVKDSVSSGPLTQPKEKQGYMRETILTLERPKDLKNIKAWEKDLKAFLDSPGGKVEILTQPRKPQTWLKGKPVENKYADSKKGSSDDEDALDNLLARYEEGKPADPTENMTEEDAKEWKNNTEEYGDKFKESRFEEGVHADPTQNMSPEDKATWEAMNEEYGDKFKTASTIQKWDNQFLGPEEAKMLGDKRFDYKPFHELTMQDQRVALSRYPHKHVGAKYDFVDQHFYYPVDSSGQLVKTKAPRVHAIPLKLMKDDQYMEGLGYEVNPEWKGKTAAELTGLYGHTKRVQSDCEACIRKLSRTAEQLAKTAWRKDENVAPFLSAHAKRAGSVPAAILVEAMKGLGPKVASMITSREAPAGLTDNEERLWNALWLIATNVHRDESTNASSVLDKAFREYMEAKESDMEEDFKAIKTKMVKVLSGHWSKTAGTRHGLYGFGSKTSSLGLQACNAVHELAGHLASDLHSRRAEHHSNITSFFKQHNKETKCARSRLLLSCYPDAGVSKKASVEMPQSVRTWLDLDI